MKQEITRIAKITALCSIGFLAASCSKNKDQNPSGSNLKDATSMTQFLNSGKWTGNCVVVDQTLSIYLQPTFQFHLSSSKDKISGTVQTTGQFFNDSNCTIVNQDQHPDDEPDERAFTGTYTSPDSLNLTAQKDSNNTDSESMNLTRINQTQKSMDIEIDEKGQQPVKLHATRQ